MDADALRALYASNDDEQRERWHRSLSFEDGMFDRWERARRLGFADGVSIYNSAMVLEPVTVGEGTWIGPWVLLDGSGGGLTIGSHCSISAGVQIYTHDTVRWALSGGTAPRKAAPVSVGDRCYIGPGVIIPAGVNVGSMCVVGANSFVRDDVPDRTVVAGSPARMIGRVVGDGDDVRIVRQVEP